MWFYLGFYFTLISNKKLSTQDLFNIKSRIDCESRKIVLYSLEVNFEWLYPCVQTKNCLQDLFNIKSRIDCESRKIVLYSLEMNFEWLYPCVFSFLHSRAGNTVLMARVVLSWATTSCRYEYTRNVNVTTQRVMESKRREPCLRGVDLNLLTS